jgi:hypothetical protein
MPFHLGALLPSPPPAHLVICLCRHAFMDPSFSFAKHPTAFCVFLDAAWHHQTFLGGRYEVSQPCICRPPQHLSTYSGLNRPSHCSDVLVWSHMFMVWGLVCYLVRRSMHSMQPAAFHPLIMSTSCLGCTSVGLSFFNALDLQWPAPFAPLHPLLVGGCTDAALSILRPGRRPQPRADGAAAGGRPAAERTAAAAAAPSRGSPGRRRGAQRGGAPQGGRAVQRRLGGTAPAPRHVGCGVSFWGLVLRNAALRTW